MQMIPTNGTQEHKLEKRSMWHAKCSPSQAYLNEKRFASSIQLFKGPPIFSVTLNSQKHICMDVNIKIMVLFCAQKLV